MIPNIFSHNPLFAYNPFMLLGQHIIESQIKTLEAIASTTTMFPLKLELPLERIAIKIEIYSIENQYETMRTIDGEVLDKERNN